MVAEPVAAPAPGSLKTANLSEGAGDGFGCLPSSDKAKAPGLGLLIIQCWGVKVYPAEENPWNGWLTREGEVASFEAGVYFSVLEHLRRCRRCRRKNKLSSKDVTRSIAYLVEEWTKRMQLKRKERTVIKIEEECRLILIRERQFDGKERRRYEVEGFITRPEPELWGKNIKTAGYAWVIHGETRRTLEYLDFLGLRVEVES
jgi:hypothetical protein